MIQNQKLRIELIPGILLLLGAIAICGLSVWKGVALTDFSHVLSLIVPNFVLLGILLFSAFGPGSKALRLIGFRDACLPEFYLFSLPIGLGILAHLVFLIGALQFLYTPVAWLLLLIGSLLSAFEIYTHKDQYFGLLRKLAAPRFVNWFCSILLLILLLTWGYSLFSTALLPPFQSDEIAYHLAIPKIYIQNHAVTYIPFIPYANWPLETEMLFTLSLLVHSEILAHLIEWTAMIFVCLGLLLFGRRTFNLQVGLVAAVIFATTPMVMTLAGSGLIELALTLYSFLSVMTLIHWIKTEDRTSWVLSALFGGFAASVKLNAAVIPLILGVFMAATNLAYKKTDYRKAILQFISYGLIAFLVVFPWYIKSWVFTGNPIWPFLYPIFGGRNWDSIGNANLLGFIQKPNLPLTVGNWLAGLWKLASQPLLFGPGNVRLSWSYLFLLPLAIPAFLFLKKKQRKDLIFLAIIGVLLYTSWFLQTHQSRFLMPATPVLAFIGAAGVSWLWSIKENRWKSIIQLSLLAGFIWTSWLIQPEDWNFIKTRWPYLSGNMTREEFLSEQIPGYQTMVYANQALPQNSYIWLGLYEPRGYYLDRKYMWANPISQRFIRLEEYQDADQLFNELRKLGFTHLMFRMTNLESYHFIPYADDYVQLITSLLQSPHVHLMYQAGGLNLYEFLP